MRGTWLCVALLSAACASKPVVKPLDAVALAAADARFLEGCYDCLIEAREAYTRLAAGVHRPLLVSRLFESELLIALREKELALDFSASIARARALTGELPAEMEASRYVELFEAVPRHRDAWSRVDRNAFLQTRLTFAQTSQTEIAWLQTPTLRLPVRQYLALTVDCAYRGSRLQVIASTALRASINLAFAPPLVKYKVFTCPAVLRDSLIQLREDVPAFVDTSYFVGDVSMPLIVDGSINNAREIVFEVVAKFPASPAVSFLAGTYYKTVGDCASALTKFEGVLARVAEHEDAWLERTVCATALERRDDAIAFATHIIDRAMDNRGEALYWRAHNHRMVGKLDLARADIDNARAMRLSASILTLAGVIEYDQEQLLPARADLERVQELPGQLQNCTAMWYLGLIYAKQSEWPRAAPTFERSMGCFGNAASIAEEKLRGLLQVDSTTFDQAFLEHQIASLRQVVADNTKQARVSAVNAAKFFAVVGTFDRASVLLARAEGDETLTEEITTVRNFIAERPGSAR